MDKNNKKILIGQPIFKQILNLIPKNVIDTIVFKMKSDRYCKSFSTFDELITLLFGIFGQCDSAREVCDGMSALSGKLNHLGMDCAPAKKLIYITFKRIFAATFHCFHHLTFEIPARLLAKP